MTRIHVVSLPHTLLTRRYDWCAYTAKVRRLVDMLAMADIDALVYGPDVQEVAGMATDYATIVDEADRMAWFGAPEWDNTKVFDRWDTNDISWRTTNERAAEAIRERWQPGDILGLIGGLCQQAIITALADLKPLVCEWGIGYSGVIPGTHRVYESYAWMHHVAGWYHDDDIKYFDTVIPNCFDPADFRPSYSPGSYLLYMGRPNPRKGLAIVAEMAKRIEIPLLVAGQVGPEIPGTEYVGLVTGKEKADLLAGARALIAPTVYLEPFGGVAVEAMLSGTPVLAPDFGAFTETVINGVSGYRCRMLADYLDGLQRTKYMDREAVHQHAIDNYTISVGSAKYGDYLRRLETLYADGWYTAADMFPPA